MYLLIFLSALSASTFILSKNLLAYAPPIFIIGIRMLGAGLIFFLYYILTATQDRKKVEYQDVFLFIQTGLISFYFSFIFEIWSLQYLTSAKTAFLYNLSPFVACVFSYIFFNEKMTLKKFIGLLIGFVGFIPILISNPSQEPISFGFISWAELGMICAVLCYTYGWIVMRRLIKKKYTAPFINAVGMLIGGISAIITSYLTEFSQFGTNVANPILIIPITNFMSFSIFMGLLILIGNILSYSLYGYFLRKYTATFVTFADFTGPLFAAVFGWIFLKEMVTWHFFVSTVIVFIGVYIFYLEELRQGYFEKDA